MVFKNLKGYKVKVKKPYIYRVDWNGDSLSKVQRKVKKLLQEKWASDFVYEEFPVAGTRMSFDFYNATKNIVIEVDGKQHYQYNKHFHSNSRQKFLDQLNRDDIKERFCDLNGIALYRIREEEDLEEQLNLLEI